MDDCNNKNTTKTVLDKTFLEIDVDDGYTRKCEYLRTKYPTDISDGKCICGYIVIMIRFSCSTIEYANFSPGGTLFEKISIFLTVFLKFFLKNPTINYGILVLFLLISKLGI